MSIGTLRVLLAVLLFATMAATHANAAAIFNVTLDTGALTVPPGATSGPFSLFFQLTDGSGPGNGNNTVTLTDLDLGGGSLTPGTTDFTGGVTGDLTAGLTLTDSSFLSFFQQSFVPGAFLSFVVSMTTNLNGDPGSTPDLFAFSLFDVNGPIPTFDSDGISLLKINIDSAAPLIESFASDPAQTAMVLNAPQVTAVPEPATLLLMATGLGASGLLRRRRRLRGTAS